MSAAAGVPTCSGLTRTLDVDPAGTASTIRSWLLLEHPGPWAFDGRERAYVAALGDAGWQRLQDIWAAEQLRPLLIRRPGRAREVRETSLIVGSTRDGRQWLERLPAAALPGVDLDALAAGESGHGEPMDGPLFAVCTNGSVDRCCAVRGRPLAAALATAHPGQTWEVSHVGGCHFAANLLVLPDGVLHGMLTPEAGLRVAAEASDGRLDPARMRGLTARVGPCAGFAMAADIAVRRMLALTAADAVTVVAEQPHDDVVVEQDEARPAGADVLLTAGTSTWRAVVRRRDRAAAASACEPDLTLTTAEVIDLVPA